MIGNKNLANIITMIDWSKRENEDCHIRFDSIGDIPEGWEYVGSGAYRHAFMGPDGYVYKVHTACAVNYGSTANSQSFDKYRRLVDFGVPVAKCDYFTESNVMVQEYVDGDIIDSDLHTDEWLRVSAMIDAWVTGSGCLWIDFHSENFRMVKGEPVLIDW